MLAIVAASHSHPKVAFAFICVIEIRGFWLLVPIQLFGQHDNGDDDDKMVMLPTTMVKKHKKKRALGIWTLRPATSLPIGLQYLVLEGALVTARHGVRARTSPTRMTSASSTKTSTDDIQNSHM